jgi:Tol biopolymer transport system component
MAQGADLQTILPVAGAPMSMTLPGNVFDLDWSADSRRFIFMQYDPSDPDNVSQHILIGPLDSDAPVPSPGAAAPISFTLNVSSMINEASLGLDGVTYSTWAAGAYQLCQADIGGGNAGCFGLGSQPVLGLSLSPDGNWISYASQSGNAQNLYRVSRDGAQQSQLTEYPGGTVDRARWSPDSRQIAYIYVNEDPQTAQLWLINADGSDPRLLLDGIDFASEAAPAWSPEGTMLAVPAREGLYLVQADGSGAALLPETSVGIYHSLAFTPVGSGWPLFYHVEQDGNNALYAIPAPDQPPLLLTARTSAGPFFSPDGRWAVLLSRSPAAETLETTLYLMRIYPDFWDQP